MTHQNLPLLMILSDIQGHCDSVNFFVTPVTWKFMRVLTCQIS